MNLPDAQICSTAARHTGTKNVCENKNMQWAKTPIKNESDLVRRIKAYGDVKEEMYIAFHTTVCKKETRKRRVSCARNKYFQFRKTENPRNLLGASSQSLIRGYFPNTQKLKRIIREMHGDICHICGKVIFDDSDFTLDHVKPLSKGGLTTVSNLKPAHQICNSQKELIQK